MKKQYCLLFLKEVYTVHPQRRSKKMVTRVVMYIYRAKGKFHLDHSPSKRTMFYWWQAWFWNLLIYLLGRNAGQKVFYYKQTSGRVQVAKVIDIKENTLIS